MGAVLIAAPGCRSQTDRLQQHAKTFESLGSSATAIVHAWLSGDVSGAYARTALDQVYTLTEKERSTLVRSPETLTDPRAARLAERAEQLSRAVAALAHDVQAGDAAGAHRHATEIPFQPAEHR